MGTGMNDSNSDSNDGIESTETDQLPVPKTVSLEHVFFSSVKGSYFRMLEDSNEAVMVTPLETGAVDLKISGIIQELKLPEDSPDTHMLHTIVDALSYVPGIKIGDPIPSELHSGKASWEITDVHRATARARLSMQLVTWLSGDEEVMTNTDQLAMVADDPAMKTKINEAFGEAAEKLGLERDQREEVVSIVDGLSEELAYIEALRDQFGRITVVEERIKESARVYRSERAISETITATSRLSNVAIRSFRDVFETLDAQTGEIMAVLRNVAAQIKFIREQRDDLHRRFWAWQEIVEKWEFQPAKRSPNTEKLLQETYHFLAQRYLPQSEWELFSKAQERASKLNTEKTW